MCTEMGNKMVIACEKVIEATELVKRFDKFEAVSGLTLSVCRGECFGLLGPNGAGKTSFVRMVQGFSPVSAGRLEVFGMDVTRHSREVKAKLGVVPQEDNLDPDLSVFDNLLVYAGYFRIDKHTARQRAEEILEFMELREKSGEVVEHLSGGLKRRLTIGRALINQPELLLLDEPTTGLDPYARHQVWGRLRKLKESGTTLLLTTHYLEEASQLCDRLVILHRGQILEQGTPVDLIESHVGAEALELGVKPEDSQALIECAGELLKAEHRLEESLILFSDQGRRLEERIAAEAQRLGIALSYRRLRPANLEDVFLKLTGETLKEGVEEHTWEGDSHG